MIWFLIFLCKCFFFASLLFFSVFVTSKYSGSFIIGVFPVFTRIKRNLFPCVEFKIGQNALIEEKNASKRNFIVGTVVIGTVLGIVGNYISDFIF